MSIGIMYAHAGLHVTCRKRSFDLCRFSHSLFLTLYTSCNFTMYSPGSLKQIQTLYQPSFLVKEHLQNDAPMLDLSTSESV